jgi:hypothetical protein
MALVPCVRPRKTTVLTRRNHPSASPLSPSSFPSRGHWPVDPRSHTSVQRLTLFPRSVSPPGGPRPRVRPHRRVRACLAPLTSGPSLAVAPPIRCWRPSTQPSTRPSRWFVDPACQASASVRLLAHPASYNRGRPSEIWWLGRLDTPSVFHFVKRTPSSQVIEPCVP